MERATGNSSQLEQVVSSDNSRVASRCRRLTVWSVRRTNSVYKDAAAVGSMSSLVFTKPGRGAFAKTTTSGSKGLCFPRSKMSPCGTGFRQGQQEHRQSADCANDAVRTPLL